VPLGTRLLRISDKGTVPLLNALRPRPGSRRHI